MGERNPGIGTFTDMFKAVRGTDESPFPYQERLALAARWPDMLIAPTGLGKTAAVILAWAWARMQRPEKTPRRLVYCLPMRTLVTQTVKCATQWLGELEKHGGKGLPTKVYSLMGGVDRTIKDNGWIEHPEKPAILIGTQDMLLSKALMRGYGMSRFRWPIDFALLQWDAQWVFDEVQLMGAALPTSSQLEAFRRGFASQTEKFTSLSPARSLWISATLNPNWLETIDFKKKIKPSVVWRWEDSFSGKTGPSTEPEILRRRLDAKKEIQRAKTNLTKEGVKENSYAKELAKEILATHRHGKTTLAILNTVSRAQALYRALQKNKEEDTQCVLLHSRFREEDRKRNEERLPKGEQHKNLIVVATQAVEAGVDLTSAVLFTELAPWASLIQRFGRCNRFGELQGDERGAAIYWIDIEMSDKDLLRPYEKENLQKAYKQHLKDLKEASPRSLKDPGEIESPRHVLRRKDLLELFDTEPDLLGYDLDVSSYIRDEEDTDLQIFWRNLVNASNLSEKKKLKDVVALQEWPDRAELCAIPISQARSFLKKISKMSRFTVDPNSNSNSKEKLRKIPWTFMSGEARPGLTVMLDEQAGGYDPEIGFDPKVKKGKVKDLRIWETATCQEGDINNNGGIFAADADPDSERKVFVGLPQHLSHVREEAETLCRALGVSDDLRESICRAALWHDVGKAHKAFQARMISDNQSLHPRPEGLLAKARKYDIYAGEEGEKRPYFRHELVSALAYLASPNKTASDDLIAYLVAAHHGKVRMGIRSMPKEKKPPPEKGNRFARGVWDGDKIGPFTFGQESIGETVLSLEIMEIGEGSTGPSWGERTQGLLKKYGPFKLALLETLVRIADWRASAKEEKRGQDDV